MISDPLVVHMGNVVPKQENILSHSDIKRKSRISMWGWPPIKKLLLYFYNKVFQIYYDS